jgi:hypothetical protein
MLAWLVLINCASVLICTVATAAISLKIKVQSDDIGLPSRMEGEFHASSGSSECFYLPYNDQEFGDYNAIERRLEIQQSTFQQIAKIPVGQTIRFSARPLRLPDAPQNIWVWEGFHPRRLARCPDPKTPAHMFEFAGSEEISASVEIPSAWEYAGIGAATGDIVHFKGSQFGFALTKGMERASFQVDKVPVNLVYRSQDFLKLLPTIKLGIQKFPEWFTDYPFESLTLLEADQLEVTGIPGLVLFNKPRQASLASIQIDWLNWSHWVMLGLIGRQWLGARATLSELRDDWLFRGTIEYATLELLKETSARFNIFNSIETGRMTLEFNYRELQDLGATVLFQDEPNVTLTDDNYQTVLPLDKQHSQLALRHSLAMRYAVFRTGLAASQKLLQQTFAALKDRRVDPRSFASQLKTHEQQGPAFMQALDFFWRHPGWSDFDIEDFSYDKINAGYSTTVIVKQLGALDLSTDVTITDVKGNETVVPLIKQGDRLTGSAVMLGKPAQAEVDADRVTYDSNRFNNTTRWPSLKFFPGNASGIPDDELTVLWAPYPFRRPGQPWSLALNAGLLRYINATTFLMLETEIGGRHRSAFSISETYKLPRFSLIGNLTVSQDLFGNRIYSKELSYGPIFSVGPRVDLLAAARRRQVVGKVKSGHQTIAGGTAVRNRGQVRYLGYRFAAEYESAPQALSQQFQYDRRVATAELLATAPDWAEYRLRFFRGEYTYSGTIPEELLFNPEDLQLARLRLDVGGLERSAKIYSIGNDLFLPFSFKPVSGTVLLSRRLRWRLFYDYGRALDLDTEYRSAGGGVLIPMGGDVSGVGTLALTRFNLMVVTYSHAEGEASYKPRFLFTFGADL